MDTMDDYDLAAVHSSINDWLLDISLPNDSDTHTNSGTLSLYDHMRQVILLKEIITDTGVGLAMGRKSADIQVAERLIMHTECCYFSGGEEIQQCIIQYLRRYATPLYAITLFQRIGRSYMGRRAVWGVLIMERAVRVIQHAGRGYIVRRLRHLGEVLINNRKQLELTHKLMEAPERTSNDTDAEEQRSNRSLVNQFRNTHSPAEEKPNPSLGEQKISDYIRKNTRKKEHDNSGVYAQYSHVHGLLINRKGTSITDDLCNISINEKYQRNMIIRHMKDVSREIGLLEMYIRHSLLQTEQVTFS